MITRQYQTYYGIHHYHHTESWAGTTYNKILVKEYPDSDISTSSYTINKDVSFLYPTLYKNRYYLDGTAEGHIKIYNTHSTTTYNVTSYTVTLKKTPNIPGDETTLGSQTETITSSNNVPPEDYIVLPIVMNINKQRVDENEKILLNIVFTGNDSSDLAVEHFNDSTIESIKIKLPYAPTG